MSAGKCPHCKSYISNVNLSGTIVNASGGQQWNSVSYTCPLCSSILSVAIDPIALKTDILDELKRLLRR